MENRKEETSTYCTLVGHTGIVYKVIDGAICSCSKDKTIKFCDNNTYQSITTITPSTDKITSVIKLNNNYIISGGCYDDKTTYECVRTIQSVSCCSCDALEKLNNHTVLLGDYNEIFVVDVESSGAKKFYDYTSVLF